MYLKLTATLMGLALLGGCAATVPQNSKTAASLPAPLAASNGDVSQQSESAYHLGLLHIQSLCAENPPLDWQAFEHGLRDALAGKSLPMPASSSDWQALANFSYAELKAANLAAGKAFLAQNQSKPDVAVLSNGVQYQVLIAGKGDKPKLKDTIGILYTIKGLDGKVKIDTMAKGQSKMYEIALQNIISKGWREALQEMPLGSKWRLFIPGDLAFGDKGLTDKDILPNEALIIDAYLLEIK